MTIHSYKPIQKLWSLLFISSLILISCSKDGNISKVQNLEVEHLTNPIGIDKVQPRFSWIYDDDTRGSGQTAFRVIVSESFENLENGQGNLWDSGKVNSSNTVNVRYEGESLQSGQKYFWKAKVWDQDGNSASWSQTQQFQMGLLNPDDWQAQGTTSFI